MRRFLRRLRYGLFRRRYQQELREEMEAHRALRQWHLEQAGVDRAHAVAESTRRLGAVLLAREDADETWLGSVDRWVRDVGYGLRALGHHRAFTVTAVLTLAVCLGVNAALFSVVYHVLWRPLPLPESDRLVLMTNAYPKLGVESDGASLPDYLDRRRVLTVFDEQALFQPGFGAVYESGLPSRVALMRVTPSFFRLLHVPARLGRTFTEAEGTVGHTGEVVLSEALWRSAFGADPNVVGRTLRLDGEPLTIVGVMPVTFAFLDGAAMCWTPLAFTPADSSDQARHVNQWQHLGRLKAGATLAEAQAELDALNAANLDRFPQFRSVLAKTGFRTVASRVRDDLVKDVRRPLTLIWVGAVLVLVIGVVNVASLVRVRADVRASELAIRAALGAGPAQLVRQALTEHVLLTLGSATVGLAGGAALLEAAAAGGLLALPRAAEIGLDPTVTVATLLTAVIVGTLLGTLSLAARRAAGGGAGLRAESRTYTRGSGRTFRRGLVATQVALAFVLASGAGLFTVSFRHLLQVDPGFRTEAVISGSVDLPASRYADERTLRAFTDEALARIGALPDVRTAAATTTLPVSGSYRDRAIAAEGPHGPADAFIVPSQVIVTPTLFDTLGIPLVRGRLFDARDDAHATPVALVDETLAREFWPGQDPIGRRLYFPGADKDHFFATTDETHWFTVVGVVGDIKLKGVLGSRRGFGTYYFPYAQQAGSARRVTLVVRTNSSSPVVPALRRIVADLDSTVPLFDIEPLAERLNDSVWRPRALMELSSAFSAIALALASLGIYGVLSFLVAERRRELGIRMVLGGRPAAIVALVLGEAGRSMSLGLVMGAAAIGLVGRALTSELFDVTAADPWVLSGAVLVLLALGLAGAGLPARRAARLDPVRTLAE